MITRQQAANLRPGDIIHSLEYNNADGTPERWRVNGKVKVWKTRPDDFMIPVKRGMYQFGRIEPWNARHFVLASEDERTNQ